MLVWAFVSAVLLLRRDSSHVLWCLVVWRCRRRRDLDFVFCVGLRLGVVVGPIVGLVCGCWLLVPWWWISLCRRPPCGPLRLLLADCLLLRPVVGVVL